MERKASDFVNMPIIDLTSGSQLAKAKNVVLNAENDALSGFICENHKFLPRNKVKNLGKDAIIVEENISSLLEKIKIPLNPPLFLPEYLIGTPIVTQEGRSIGIVGDILINGDTGQIEGYEVSDGLLKDLVSGRSIISIPQVITYGEDAVVISEL
ncbi:MAG: PRC-barrel domain-containing protein [Bacillota bacterium]